MILSTNNTNEVNHYFHCPQENQQHTLILEKKATQYNMNF